MAPQVLREPQVLPVQVVVAVQVESLDHPVQQVQVERQEQQDPPEVAVLKESQVRVGRVEHKV